MVACLASIGNCKVCEMGRNDLCIMCSPGYYLFNNVCIQNCTDGFIAYENVCVLREIQNCAVHHLLTVTEPLIINYALLSTSDPYLYYINAGV